MLLSLDVMLVTSTVLRSGGHSVDKGVVEVVTFVADVVVVVAAARIMVVAATVVVVLLVITTEIVVFM